MMGKQNINENDMSNFIFSSNKGKDTSIRNITHKFTGQEYDAETGLYYYNVRYYDPEIGKFITADTIIPNPLNTQSFNRYSYVENNPINFNDPSGHSASRRQPGARGGGNHGGGGNNSRSGVYVRGAFVNEIWVPIYEDYSGGHSSAESSASETTSPNNGHSIFRSGGSEHGGSTYSGTHSGLKTNPNMKSGGRNNKTKNNITVNYVDNFFQSPVVNDVSFYLGTGSTIIGLMEKAKFIDPVPIIWSISTVGGVGSFVFASATWAFGSFGFNDNLINFIISGLGAYPTHPTMWLSLYLTAVKIEYNYIIKPVIEFKKYSDCHSIETYKFLSNLFGGQ